MLSINNIESLLIEIDQKMILVDRDVAQLYGVETKFINRAVKNNPEKFPKGYIIELSEDNKKQLVQNLNRFKTLKHSSENPKAFTEKGLYMLATILKSKTATKTTLAIIETFTKIKNLHRQLDRMEKTPDDTYTMDKVVHLLTQIIQHDEQKSETETTVEINLALLKLKHRIKNEKYSNRFARVIIHNS